MPQIKDRNSLPKHTLHPRDDFVTGRIRWFVEIYDPGTNVRLEVPLERCAAIGDGRKVTSANKYWVTISFVL
jgi:hypothetical protein